MRIALIQILRFVLFVFAQALIFNQIEVGFGIHVMIYPLFIFLLPIQWSVFVVMLISFAMGFSIDSLGNTYGLHASSAVFLAYLRPMIFKVFEPRDGYENLTESSIYDMDTTWLMYVFGSMLLIHHFWFFTIELFKFNEILFIFQKTLLSVPISMVICILIQLIFVRRRK